MSNSRRSGRIVNRGKDKWLVRIYRGRDSEGKRTYVNTTIFGSKKDAQKWLTAKLREKDLGICIEPATMHLNSFLDKWLEEIARVRVRPVTFDGYEAKLKVHVRDTIGRKRLCDLHAYDAQ